MRVVSFFAVAVVASLAVALSVANASSHNPWPGVWTAPDPFDGSAQQITITTLGAAYRVA